MGAWRMEADKVRLRLFGGFALEVPSSGEPPSLPKRAAEAVLAVLAVCGVLGCTRARLVGLLWPESDDAHARHNLRNAVHGIRKALGHDAVLSQGDLLRLNAAKVASDVSEFSDAWRDGRLAEAVSMYRGPLLDGVQPSRAMAFERWVEDERNRLFRDCLEAVKRLAKGAEQKGRWDGAADWWARAVAMDRHNSRLVVRRMIALARAGDRVNALAEAEAHCEQLMSELQLEPDPAFLEEVDRVRTGEVGPVGYFTPAPLRRAPDLDPNPGPEKG
ncbi:MAG: BTAD domain-containing putative transcriptional regulator [Gemmatimonadota bacterium]